MHTSIVDRIEQIRRSPMPAKTTAKPTNGAVNGAANGHTNGHAKTPVKAETKSETKPVKSEVTVETNQEVKTTKSRPRKLAAPEHKVKEPDVVDATNETSTPEVVASVVDQVLTPEAKRSASKSAKPRAKSAGRTKSKPRAKSAGRAKPTRKSGKGSLKKTKQGKQTTSEPKQKRVHNTKATSLETQGIGVGTARVRNAVRYCSLNPREYAVRNALRKAENKPVMPKSTDEKSEPVMPPQGPQTPISQLPEEVQAVVREAVAAYEDSLRDAYERTVVEKYAENGTKAEYEQARKEAKAKFDQEHKNDEKQWVHYPCKEDQFDLHAFNLSYDPKFYDGFAEYKKTHDHYQIGHLPNESSKDDNKSKFKGLTKNKSVANKVVKEPYNEWTRAMALLNKIMTRLSGRIHYIIACFLDRVVEQYAENGILNCFQDNRRTVNLNHALTVGPNFENTCYLHKFVETLDHYRQATTWLKNCTDAKSQHKDDKKAGTTENVKAVLPDYPKIYEDNYSFTGYVVDICREVRKRLAAAETDPKKKELLISTNVSNDFKQFCSYILYEIIMRIGDNLKILVEASGVKTVSDAMVYQTLQQIHTTCGMDYQKTRLVMQEHLIKFSQTLSKPKTAKPQTDAAPADDDDSAGEAEEPLVEETD